MAKVVTAADVEQARNQGSLIIEAGTVVTPLARDKARELGVELVEQTRPSAPAVKSAPAAGVPSEGLDGDLAAKIRSIVTSLLASAGGGEPAPTSAGSRHPVLVRHPTGFTPQAFDEPVVPATMNVTATDVVGADNGAPMAAGYMTLTKGEFPWTLTYDEIQIVLEGELHLGGDAGGKVGRAGDILFVPKGSRITFGTPTWAKFVYVTFPANWGE